MDKLPVGQLPDLQQSNNDDEIMVITNSEYSQLKKEKISDLITDFTSTNENNALTKGTDGKMFVTDFGNASNITEGTLPVSVLPDIPKDKLPEIETDDLPDSGITAGTYTYPTDIVINSKGQVTSITEGQPGANNANQDLSNLGPLGLDKLNQSKALETGSVSSDADVYADIQKYAHSTFDLSKFTVVGSPTITADGVYSSTQSPNTNYIKVFDSLLLGKNIKVEYEGIFGHITDGKSIGNTSICMFREHSATSNPQFGHFLAASTKLNDQTCIWYNSQEEIPRNVSGYYLTVEGDKYKVVFTFNETRVNFELFVNGVSKMTDYQNISDLEITSLDFYIGSPNFVARQHTTTVDLKSISITVDGKEVFNGNKTGLDIVTINDEQVEIPYTLSKTGSKIVDAAYRDRVQDMYEQYGYAPYYTIDEENQNFTLPMGEIYGMIEGKKQNAHAIGEPIIRLDNTLYSNEIRLEGALVSKTTYADLYKVYGDNYAIATEDITDETKFYLPDFRNRAVWGSSGFGYLGAGLPPITGTIKASNIWAGSASASGCFSVADNGDHNAAGNGSSRGRTYTWTLNASSSSSIYGNSDTVQPPAIKVRVVTRFKDEDYPIVIESGNTNNSDGLDDILG